MKHYLTIAVLMCTLAPQITAQTCEWSELIGKPLVLYRYGRLQDGIFTEFAFTNPAGPTPVETLVLTDSTHFDWKYSLSGDFSREIELKGNKIDVYPPFWNNRYISIVSRNDNVIMTEGHDGITRLFFIPDAQPAPAALPVSCNSQKGFCDGKLDDLMSSFSDFTYHSSTPMGRHFLYVLKLEDGMKEWLEGTDAGFNTNKGLMKPFDVKPFPNGAPVLSDVNQKLMTDGHFISALAEIAYLYPDFIQSIIHQESPDVFRVDLFDPMGQPIVVRINNQFPLTYEGAPELCVGKDGQPNWATILEKAVMKWIKLYQPVANVENCCTEWVLPILTGDGRSFCVQPGKLSAKDLSRVITTCLNYGMIVCGGFMNGGITLDGLDLESNYSHGYSFLPPQKAGALFSIRDTYGTGDADGIMNVMPDNTSVPPLINLRILSPGAAAKFFKQK